jgi:hypothetical protein
MVLFSGEVNNREIPAGGFDRMKHSTPNDRAQQPGQQQATFPSIHSQANDTYASHSIRLLSVKLRPAKGDVILLSIQVGIGAGRVFFDLPNPGDALQCTCRGLGWQVHSGRAQAIRAVQQVFQ